MLKGMPTSFGDFSSIQVGKRIAQGGAGTIFSLSSHPGFVLKKYHQDSDLKRSMNSQLLYIILALFEQLHFIYVFNH